MVDTTDLKSVGLYARAGSSPAFRTIKSLVFGAFFCFPFRLQNRQTIFSFVRAGCDYNLKMNNVKRG